MSCMLLHRPDGRLIIKSSVWTYEQCKGSGVASIPDLGGACRHFLMKSLQAKRRSSRSSWHILVLGARSSWHIHFCHIYLCCSNQPIILPSPIKNSQQFCAYPTTDPSWNRGLASLPWRGPINCSK